MKKTVILLLLTVLISISAFAKQPDKKGILLVTFGSSYPETRVAFQNIEKEMAKAFPNIPIRWAYTSKIIRNKLRKRGENINSPAMALAQMAEDGFTHVAVQSLHIIPGLEYNALRQTVSAFNHMPKALKQITLGKPLLFSNEDNEKLAHAIKNIFADKLPQADAFVFMGHGSEHASNIYYAGFQYYLSQQSPKFMMGTVEGFPTLQNVMDKIEKNHVKSIWLTPFMSVAGDHARNDMAGDEDDSWKIILQKKNIEVKPILKGLAQYNSVVAIWIEHLKIAVDELQ